jgi:NAD(P)-dependent dehydrogenase (short-subunit alcohol dehydrogenase family)
MGKLEGKMTIVTGAGSGIGKAIAHMFAQEGGFVLVADIAGAEEAARGIGGQAVPFVTDVSRSDNIQAMVAAAVSWQGRIDVLVNNAGIEGEQATTSACTEDNFDRVIAINLRGAFLGMKYALPVMLRGGGGCIINVASVAGLVGFPGLPAYCASKGGMIQLTRAAALEYATSNVRVNAICPGVIWTPMVARFAGESKVARAQMEQMEPVGRMGMPDEVAALAVFLASDESSFITGAALPIDGALTAR